MTVSFSLPFPISLNNIFVNGYSGRFKSQRYKHWIEEAGKELMRQRPAKIKGPVEIHLTFEKQKDGRKRDGDNLPKCINDLLVAHGIIEADDSSILTGQNWRFGDVEGVQVTIWPQQVQE